MTGSVRRHACTWARHVLSHIQKPGAECASHRVIQALAVVPWDHVPLGMIEISLCKICLALIVPGDTFKGRSSTPRGGRQASDKQKWKARDTRGHRWRRKCSVLRRMLGRR